MPWRQGGEGACIGESVRRRETDSEHRNSFALHPPPCGLQIKKRIEDLIERDFLERDKENPQMFKYLA
jgi:hypothetical protein